MKRIIAMLCLIVGCGAAHHQVRHYQINKTTAVVRCDKLDRCRKDMALHCSEPVEIDNGYNDHSGYWLLYSCYKCGR